MRKRGQIWVSAVLYMALGVIVLTIVLSAGVPLIQKMKDKNTVTQTKNLFFVLDENIIGVLNEGPGAKRFLSPFEIQAGEFYVGTTYMSWNLPTTAKLIEPGVPISEGAVVMKNAETIVEDEFVLDIHVNYTGKAELRLNSEFQSPFVGVYSLSIKHTGEYVDNKPIVEIALLG